MLQVLKQLTNVVENSSKKAKVFSKQNDFKSEQELLYITLSAISLFEIIVYFMKANSEDAITQSCKNIKSIILKMLDRNKMNQNSKKVKF